MNTYDAIVLNDYGGKENYATFVHDGLKTLETRMKMFNFKGDTIICCGNKSVTKYAGLAICIVHFGKGRPMTDEDAKAAMIHNSPGRIVYPLTNLRHFSKKFMFSKRKVSGSFQGIFQITIPDGIEIIEPPVRLEESDEEYRRRNSITGVSGVGIQKPN